LFVTIVPPPTTAGTARLAWPCWQRAVVTGWLRPTHGCCGPWSAGSTAGPGRPPGAGPGAACAGAGPVPRRAPAGWSLPQPDAAST